MRYSLGVILFELVWFTAVRLAGSTVARAHAFLEIATFFVNASTQIPQALAHFSTFLFFRLYSCVMSKSFLDSSRTAHEYVHWTALQVFHSGHIFREPSGPDIGVDGEIELMKPEATGKAKFVSRHLFLKVQLKSTIEDNGYVFVADRSNCEDWAAYGDQIPLIGIIYNAKTQKAAWMNLSLFARRLLLLPGNIQTHRKSLDIVTQKFTSDVLDSTLVPLAEQWQKIPSLLSQLDRLQEQEAMPDDAGLPVKNDLPTPDLDQVDSIIDGWIDEFTVVPRHSSP